MITTSASPYNSYLETQILSADPMQLIELLYRAAIDAVESARGHLRTGNIALRARSITKALEILNELALSLDVEKGGAIARNLAELYDYAVRRLLTANAGQVDAPLAEVKELLGTLLDGWQHCIAAQAAAAPLPAESHFAGPDVSSSSLCTTF